MKFYLRHRSTGHFVAPKGKFRSYVKSMKNAHPYPSKEAAQKDMSTDEYMVAS